MTVVLNSTTSGNQGFFNRLGEVGNALNVVNTFALTTLPAAISGAGAVMAIFDGATAEAIRNAVGALPPALVTQQGTGLDTIRNALRAVALNAAVEMADADNPLPPPRGILQALEEIRLQMIASADSVDANEPTIGQAASGTGGGVLVLSLLDGKGKTLENVYDEVIELTCSTPHLGLFTAGYATNGIFAIKGEAAESNKLSYRWPKGSGANGNMPSRSAWSTDNLILNGKFEDFTVANTPDSWTIASGSAGTHIFSDATNFLIGAKCLKFTGDGSTQIAVKQAFQAAAYAPLVVTVWVKAITSAPAAGVLRVALVNGAGSVVNDEAGTANSFTVDLTALTTSYQCFSGVFRVQPSSLGGDSELALKLETTTAISNTKEVVIDECLLQYATQLYSGGPFAALATGHVTWGRDKKFTVTVTNDYRGAIQTMTARLFDQPAFYWPSNAAGAETIPDSLIG